MEGMKGKARMLALAVLAVLALGAVGAQGAMADPLFKADEAHTNLKETTSGTYTFDLGSDSLHCTMSLAGTTLATSIDELTLIPSDSTSCVAFGFANTHIDFTDCDFLFTSTTGEGEDLHLTCPEGQQVDITPTIFGFSVCTVTVFPGTFETVGYDNVRNGDIQMTINATGISYEEHPDPGGCGVGSGTDGAFTGTPTFAGTDTEGNPVDIEVG